MSTPTPHNTARPGDFAKTVLMPGDPLRAKWIAETFFDSPKLVNDVRGVQGYTGSWKGAPVSVMASGMGIPSIGIYSWELYTEYNVENIIRVGSLGGYADEVNVRDIIIAQGACTDSNFAHQFNLNGTFAPIADFGLLSACVDICRGRNLRWHVGNILSADNFYNGGSDGPEQWKRMGVLGVEMESAGLYMTAARLGKRALTVCTVSDHLFKSEELSAEERQSSMSEMITVALDTALAVN